ncbi:MAG: tandem-95 repeat protein, partial [Sphingomonadales bacterium]|nr:tandem-95 repeat protein [Sphingomonadales bacterium]
DHEDEGNVEVEVTVTDSGGLTYSEEFTIEVTDVNEAPTDISLDETSIDENEAGAIVGNVSVVDPDAGDTVTYTVSDERFEVVDGQLKLKDGVSLNHEAEENVSVDITATDADGLSYTESFTIDVDDVNEAPTNLVVTIDEFGDDIEPGTVVGHATADDPDVGDTLTFSLDNDSDGRFVIDALTGEISVAEGAEFDDDVDYDITVRVTDEDGLYVTQAETIDIADDNDDPRSGDIHAKPFDEDTSIIITEEELLAKVHDKDSDTFSITAIADPEHGTLVDNGDGTWTYTPDPDYHGAEKIEFTISDNEGGYTSANLHLTVTPEKDEPAAVDDVVLGTEDTPVVISADSLLANDSDADGDSLSITGFTQPETGGTVADNGDGTFTFTPDADFVGDASFEYTVSDGQGGTSTATATVSVAPVEDAPTDISIDNLSIGENDDGAVIGTLSVTDPDAGDTHTYSVSDDRFEVVEGQLKLKAGESLNHEAEGNVDVEVTATDAAGNTYSETLSIEVTDVNEAPTDILLDAGGVAEGVDGAVVGNISVVDPDVDDTHIYTISDERFEVVDGQLKLKDGVSLDYEAEASVTVDITATDEDGFGYTESFTIDVGDVNEAPTDISLDNLSVAEDDEGAVIGTLSVTDPDAGDAHTYSVSDDRFEVVDGQLKLKDGESLDDDDDGDAVSIEVTATDADGLSRAETFNISITEAADDGDDDHGDDDDDDHDDDHDDDDEDNQAGQQGDDDDDHDDDDDEDEDDDHGDDHDDDDEDEADAQYDGVLPVAADDATTLTDDSDTLAASSSDDVIDAGAGDDVINAGRGDDIVLGGEGDDIIEGDKGDDTLLGGAGDDIIDGGKGEDVLYGNAGNDTLDGGGKADILIGGAGDDTIDGGSGDDIIMGGTGDDVMSGGTGNDLFLFGEDAGNDIVSGGAGTDEMDISAMAADQGWTVVLEDGSEIAGQGDDYLELTNDSSGSIQFEDGTEINFDSMDKITFG